MKNASVSARRPRWPGRAAVGIRISRQPSPQSSNRPVAARFSRAMRVPSSGPSPLVPRSGRPPWWPAMANAAGTCPA